MYTANRVTRVGVGVVAAALLSITGLPAPASAASYASRPVNLPNGVFELGLGLGIAHAEFGPSTDYTGLGVNLEVGYGLNSRLELRFRTGLRFGDDGRITDADYFGRPVQTETHRHLGGETLANPELGLRFSLDRGGTAEVALDTRLIIPVDGDVGVLIGIPLALHLQRIRLDTGLYIPITFTDNTQVDFSIPLHLWIRLDSGTFLGPMTGVYFHDGGDESVPFGIGAGTSLAYDADLRFWFLFPDVDVASDWWGTGVGLYVTF
jgi:hypothetical protein